MKLYFLILYLLTVLGLSFGVVLPFLFSAPSDLAVIGGLFYLAVVLPYVIYDLAKMIKKELTK